MSIYWNAQRSKWCYAFNINKQRYSGYCDHPETKIHADGKREALKYEGMIKADLQRQLDVGINEKSEPKPILPKGGFTLAEVIAYRLEQMKDLASYPTAKTYAKELLNYFGAHSSLENVDNKIHLYIEFSKNQQIRVYKGRDKKTGKNLYQVKDETRSEKSVNEYLKFLDKAYREFKDAPQNKKIKRYIPDPPTFKLLKTPKRIPTPIPYNVTQTYLEAFDETLHVHTRLAYIICVQTGMRAKECARILDRQYSETERVISLEAGQTKTATGRYVHVNEIAHQALMECRKIGDYLWELLQAYPHLAAEYQKTYGITHRGDISFILFRRNGTGVPRPVKHVATTAWKTTKKSTGIDYRWHDTRAAFCSDTLGADGDIDAVKKLAGHQDIQTTQKYLHASDPRLKRAVNKLAEQRPLNVETITPVKLSRKLEKALGQTAA